MANIHHSAASLRIIGDDLIPDEITKILGCLPTKAQTKGESLQASKKEQVRVAKFGMWNLKASRAEPESLDSQIQEILSKLTPDLEVWLALRKKYQIDLFCGLFMQSDNDGLTISPSTLRDLGSRNIELGLDIYGA